MRFVLLLFFTLTILLVFNSCDICSCKKVLCPAFDNTTFISWFPYDNPQTTVFKNGSGNTDTINFHAMQKSPSYEVRRGGCYGADNGACITSAEVYATSNFSNIITLRISFDGQNELQQTVSISTGNFQVQSKNIDNNGLKDISTGQYTAAFSSQLSLNGTTFNNVQSITRDTAAIKDNGIYKLYLSRNNGIVGYTYYPSLETWTKQ